MFTPHWGLENNPIICNCNCKVLPFREILPRFNQRMQRQICYIQHNEGSPGYPMALFFFFYFIIRKQVTMNFFIDIQRNKVGSV